MQARYLNLALYRLKTKQNPCNWLAVVLSGGLIIAFLAHHASVAAGLLGALGNSQKTPSPVLLDIDCKCLLLSFHDCCQELGFSSSLYFITLF